jgi:hypothetical protein
VDSEESTDVIADVEAIAPEALEDVADDAAVTEDGLSTEVDVVATTPTSSEVVATTEALVSLDPSIGARISSSEAGSDSSLSLSLDSATGDQLGVVARDGSVVYDTEVFSPGSAVHGENDEGGGGDGAYSPGAQGDAA